MFSRNVLVHINAHFCSMVIGAISKEKWQKQARSQNSLPSIFNEINLKKGVTAQKEIFLNIQQRRNGAQPHFINF